MIPYVVLSFLTFALSASGAFVDDKDAYMNQLGSRDAPKLPLKPSLPQNESLECGNGPASPDFKALLEELVAKEKKDLDKRSDDSAEPIVIDTYIHMVTNSNSTVQEETESLIPPLMEGLNNNFANHGFRFELKEFNITIYEKSTRRNRDRGNFYKLRKGNYDTLNIYLLDSIPGVWGTCTPPARFPEDAPSSAYMYDGCKILASRIVNPFVATHEIGHWLGLLHTFDGGCSEKGDYVDDTPAHEYGAEMTYSPTDHCPDGTADSCPNLPGLDPVKNYMNYVPSWCANEFTPGQADRMKSFWNGYRKENRTISGDNNTLSGP